MLVVIRKGINILSDTKTRLKEKVQKLLKKIEASEFSGDAKIGITTLQANRVEAVA